MVQETEYFPFGLDLPRAAGINKYPGGVPLYNGKEKQPETGLLDYGARQYDPTIGRFGTVDGAAELFGHVSPYSYGLGNPLLYIDPSGDTTISINDFARTPFNPEKDVVQLNEATVRPDGFYGSGGLAYTAQTKGVVAGYSAGYNGSGEYGGADVNVTGFRAEYSNTTGTGAGNLALEGGVKVTGLQGTASLTGGTENNNIGLGTEGNALLAEANGTVGILTGENNKRGAYLGGEAGAYLLKGEANPSVTVFGFKVGVTVGGSLGSAHIGGGIGGYNDGNKGTFVFKGMGNIGLGAEIKIGFNVEKTIK
ncbi:RHS repeat-associated core domain-containing protein [Dyadobacter helix]|nr:RHS repeat-associated core domain-containing protein [Dyadobacter sp. CECT 9275]